MYNTDQMPMWRKVTIAICLIIIIIGVVLDCNIDVLLGKYSYSELAKYEPLEVLRNDIHLKPMLDFDELSYEDREMFISENNNVLRKYRTYEDREEAASFLYRNKQYIDIFGLEYFRNTIELFGEEAYEKRLEILKNKFVSEAFRYLYSPYTANGVRDNRKGLGINWEKYNNMSISSKEEYIRSDFQERYDSMKTESQYIKSLYEKIILVILMLSGTCIFFLIIKKIGKRNIQARRLALYIIISMIISLLVLGILIIKNETVEISAFIACVSASIIVFSLMERYLAKMSNLEYHNYYLIPEWLSKFLKTDNEFRKRLLMVFLIYPFFFVVPVPFVGMVFFVYYILPVFIILCFIRNFLCIVSWVRDGKEIDAIPQVRNDRARLYCRHCGKLIDADSDYCRYCGKRL